MGTNNALRIFCLTLFILGCYGEISEASEAITTERPPTTASEVTDEGKGADNQQSDLEYGHTSQPSFTQYHTYLRPLIEHSDGIDPSNISSSTPAINATDELEISFSQPVDICRNCIIYRIDNNILGVREQVLERSDPFKPDAKCKVSLSEIQAIVSNFQNIISGTVMRAPDAPSEATTKDECQQALRNINTRSGELSELLKKMKNTENVSPQEYNAMKNMYQEKINKMNTQMDFVKRQADQNAKSEVEKAQRVIDEVRNKYNDAIDRLHREIAKNQEKNIELTAIYIRDGNYGAAIQKYNLIENKVDKLRKILDQAYGLDKFDNIIMFSSRLSSNSEKRWVCKHLVDIMVDKGDMENPFVLVVNQYVEELLNKRIFPSTLEKVAGKLRPGVEKVLNGYGTRILFRTEDGGSFIRLARDRVGIFDRFIKDIVKVAFSYARTNSLLRDGGSNPIDFAVQKFLDFAEELYTDNSHRSYISTAVYNEIKNNKDELPLPSVLRIGYFEYRAHRGTGSVFSKLPKDIQHIVSGKPVGMQFNYWKHLRDGAIYVVRSGDFIKDWYFSTTNGKTFFIKNSKRTELTLASSYDAAKFFPNERRVFGFPKIEDSFKHWEIRDANWKNQRYYLYNPKFEEYMQLCINAGARWSDDYTWPWDRDEGPQAACTWRDKGKGPNAIWEFRV